MIEYITITIILITILLLTYKKEGLVDITATPKISQKKNDTNDTTILKTNSKDFIAAKFHQDYTDVITAINNISPNQRQIFNINNIPCKVSKNVDLDEVERIIEDFIDSINKEVKEHVPSIRNVNSGWDENLPEPHVMDGFEKVQQQLGLPISIYNRPVMKTKVKLVAFSNVIKYETENEIRYICEISIVKEKIKDELVIKCSFVLNKDLNKSQVIIEDISVMGFNTSQGLDTNRVLSDDFYMFDSLEKNNMISREEISNELLKKYDLKRKIMQERIDGDYPEERMKYNTPSPTTYDSYQVTQTILDDMYSEKKFN
jgi:hypothetical protein